MTMADTVDSIENVSKLADLTNDLRKGCLYLTGGYDKANNPFILVTDVSMKKLNFTDDHFKHVLEYLKWLLNVVNKDESNLEIVAIVDGRKRNPSSLESVIQQLTDCLCSSLTSIYIVKPQNPIYMMVSAKSLQHSTGSSVPIVLCKSPKDLLPFFSDEQLPSILGGLHQFDLFRWLEKQLRVEVFRKDISQLDRSVRCLIRSYRNVALYLHDLEDLESVVSQQRKCRTNMLEAVNDLAATWTQVASDVTGREIVNLTPDEVDRVEGIPPDGLMQLCLIVEAVHSKDKSLVLLNTFWESHDHLLQKAMRTSQYLRDASQVELSVDRWEASLSDYSVCIVTEACAVTMSLTNLAPLGAELDLLTNEKVTELQQSCETLFNEYFDSTSSSCNGSQSDCEDLYVPSSPGSTDTSTFTPEARTVTKEYLSERHQALTQRLSTSRTKLDTTLARLNTLKSLHDALQKGSDWLQSGKYLLTSVTNWEEDLETRLSDLESQIQSRLDLGPLLNPKQFRTLFTPILTDDLNVMVHSLLERLEEVTRELTEKKKTLLEKKKQKAVIPPVSQPVTPSQPRKHDPPPEETGQLSESLPNIPAQVSDKPITNGHRKESKLGYVINELIQTERDYVTTLVNIHSIFWEQLDDRENADIIPLELAQDRTSIFANWEEIMDLHKSTILPAIENCSHDLGQLCSTFNENNERMIDLYTIYCVQHHSLAVPTLKQIGGSSQAFIKKCQTLLKQKLDMSSYLLTPFQRLHKYPLLIDQIIKTNPESHRSDLNECLNGLHNMLKHVNVSMSQADIRGYTGKLSALGRMQLHQLFHIWKCRNTITPSSSGASKQRHVFLYEKAILVCKQQDINKQVYDFELFILMSEVGLTKTPSGKELKFCIWKQDKSFSLMILAPSLSVKDQWTDAINKLLFKQLELIRLQAKQRTLNR